MMSQKQRYVFHALESGDICVFPSEISARSYLEQYALEGERHAIFSDRVMASDTFLASFHPSMKEESVVTPIQRQLFLSDALSRGLTLDHFLGSGIPRESHSRISRYLSTILPQLKDVLESEVFPTLEESLRKDYRTLYDAYSLFLARQGLHEPSYEEPKEPEAHGVFRVLFSDSTLGFSRLYERLGRPDWIIPTPVCEMERTPVLHRYGNFVEEIRNTLRTIRGLLSSGVPCRDIVISTAREEVMLERLKDEAVLHDVPLVVRNGLSPLLSPPGRLYRQIQDLYREEFSFRTMEALLLEGGIPWSDGEMAIHREVLSLAVRDSIDRGSVHGEDLWEKRLTGANRAWYRKFRSYIIAMNTEKSGEKFIDTFHGFEDFCFRSERYSGFGGENLARFCIDCMDTLREQMRRAGFLSAGEGFLSLFLSYLENKPYVPRMTEEEGINVYRWTDSASIHAPYHFFLSLDGEGAECLRRPLSCLPESVPRESRGEEDLSEGTLKAASLDGAILSYHESDYEGEHLAPAWFSKVESATAVGVDPYGDEETLWKTGLAKGESTRAQRDAWIQGRKHSMDREPPARLSHADIPWPEDVVEEEPLSSTMLDAWLKCPFRFACIYFLGIRERKFQVDIVDDRVIGEVLHKTYEKFFTLFRDTPFDGGRSSEYREEIKRLFLVSMDEVYGEGGPNPYVRAWIVHQFRDSCAEIVAAEAENFDHLKTVALEKTERREWTSPTGKTYLIRGRLDRVVSLGEGDEVAVIDYKKDTLPMTESAKEYKSTQLPVYRFLFGNVTTAGYYSVKKEKYVFIWKGDKEEMRDVGDRYLEDVLSSFDAMMRERKCAVTVEKKNCEKCAFRQICRTRYSTL